jgi:glycosyltransferase involved in cell wall biosynthesis
MERQRNRPASAAPRIVRVGLVDELADGDLVACGSRRVLADLVAVLDRARFEPVVFLASEGRFSRLLETLGARVRCGTVPPPARMYRLVGDRAVPSPAGMLDALSRIPAGAYRLGREYRREAIDVVYLSTPMSHVVGGAAARLAGLPSVCHIQGRVQTRHRVRLMLHVYRAWTLACGCTTVAISDFVADSLGGRGPLRPRVIRNASDTERFSPGPHDGTRFAQLGLDPADGPIIATVSNVSRLKRLHLLPRFAARVCRSVPGARFLVCGGFPDAAYLDGIRADLAARGVGDRVRFAGVQDDLAGLLRGCSLAAHFCKDEGFGLALTEALACGVPVVAFASGGPAEIVRSGETGWLVSDPEDAEALGDAAAALLGDAGRLRDFAIRARASAETDFSLNRFGREFEALFASLV